MTQQIIITTPVNSGNGTPIANAFNYCNTNFSELYSRVQTSPPPTLIGSPGDTAGMYAYSSLYFYYCYANYNGTNAIWAEISPGANISAVQILNGTSSIKIAETDGNANISINGTSNVAVFNSAGANVTGYVTATKTITGGNILTVGLVSATGNVTGNYIIGNGSQLVGLPPTYANSNVASYLPTYSGNITAASISATGNITTTGSVNTQGLVSATGNIVTSGYFVGNFAGNIVANIVVPGSNTQVLFNTNGNVDATAGLTFDTNGPNLLTVLGTISSQGNVIPGNVMTAGVMSAAGNITGGNLRTGGLIAGNIISLTGNATVGNLVSAGSVSATAGITSGANVTGANIITSGLVSAVGNIYTDGKVYSLGDMNAGGNISGSRLTGTSLSVTANISGGNIFAAGTISATGNVTAAGNISVTGNVAATGAISATGNVSGNFFIGNGSQLTGIVTTVSNISNGSSNVTIPGAGSNVVIGVGNSSNIVVIAPEGEYVLGVVSASGNITGGNILTAGYVSATGNITGNYILGNGSQLTGLPVTYANSNVASYLPTYSGNVQLSNILNAGANGSGNIGNSSTYFNTIFAKATSAQYADLAELYLADADYVPGTVLCFDGAAEVTQCNTDACPTVAGVVSTRPAYQMNSGLTGDHVVPVALMGRVPCLVIGPIARGDMLVSAGNGHARAEKSPAMGTVIGKALESFNGDAGTIEVVVGRL